jgi:Cysteine-rich CPXCG
MVAVTCPTCFEEFEIQPPGLRELPAVWDYDCEVCCRPMEIVFELDGDEEDGEIVAHARGLGD